MSLVNDMLRDLDAGKREPLPDGIVPDREVGGGSRGPARSLFGLALLLAIVPGAFYGGLHWRSAEVPPAAANSPALSPSSRQVDDDSGKSGLLAPDSEVKSRQPAMGGLLLESTSMPTAASDHTLAESQLPTASSKAVADNQASGGTKIDLLLDAAELALSDDRLTSPLDDNAFSRYQAVLLLEPSHPEALKGVKKVAGRYLEFYASTRRGDDRQAANYYLDKARRVTNRYPELARWLDSKVAMLADELPQSAVQSVPAGTEVLSAGASASDSAAPNWQAHGSDDMQTVRRSPSKSELDKRIAAQAQNLIQQRRYAQAQNLLLSHLDGNPQSPLSREVLVDVYLATDNLVAAQRQIQLLTDIPAHARARINARLKIHQGDIDAAMSLMEEEPPALRDVPDYHGYLAALYHKAERFSDAASVYQQLLALDDSQATYWLGLAVSLDALNDGPGALRAFRYARRYSNADSPSRRYVDERIQSLSS